MTAPVNVDFSSGTTISSAWLNGVNDHVNVSIGTTRPSSPSIGLVFFDTSLSANGKPIFYNGTNWVDYSGTIV